MPTFSASLLMAVWAPPDAQRLAGDAGEHPAFLRGGAHLAPLLQPLASGCGEGETAGLAGLGDSAGDGDGALLNVLPGQQGGLSHAHGAHHHQRHQGGIAGAGRGEHGTDLIGARRRIMQ